MTTGDWQAMHIYYPGNSRPMLTDCVRPLVDDLRGDGLLAGYFFINYWVAGQHVRLRLRPSTPDATGAVCRRAETAIERFLRERPALYQARENDNSYKYATYEPEYAKYGGAAGVALAEWHFEHSSDLVIQANRTSNLHLRPVLLGLAAQLMMIMTTVFMGDEEATIEFLERYTTFWRRSIARTTHRDLIARHDKAYEAMGDRVTRRFLDVRAAYGRHRPGDLPGILGEWLSHCVDLRDRARELAVRGELTLGDRDGGQSTVTDVTVAPHRLLTPYLHMTNNRLGVALVDEAYLGHALTRALRDRKPAEAAP